MPLSGAQAVARNSPKTKDSNSSVNKGAPTSRHDTSATITGQGGKFARCGMPNSRSNTAAASSISSSRSSGASHIGGNARRDSVGSKGLSECPVCKVAFASRIGQWEKQAHIQLCLDSLEGGFDE